MFGAQMFGLSPDQQAVEESSPIKDRLREVVEEYRDQLPTMAGVMLVPFLQKLDLVSDGTILEFIAYARGKLDYIEHGAAVDHAADHDV